MPKNAHDAIVGSSLVVFKGVGHLPQLEAPAHFVMALEQFIAANQPRQFDAEHWRNRLRSASGQS